MSNQTLRDYINIVDEAVRGVLVQPAGPNDTQDYAVRPKDQAERDLIAKGLKTARKYNRDALAYAKAPGEKQDYDPDELAQRSIGHKSGSIVQPDYGTMSNLDRETGMPVDIPGHRVQWQTRAINTKKPGVEVGTDIKANQGKATGPKRPVKPW